MGEEGLLDLLVYIIDVCECVDVHSTSFQLSVNFFYHYFFNDPRAKHWYLLGLYPGLEWAQFRPDELPSFTHLTQLTRYPWNIPAIPSIHNPWVKSGGLGSKCVTKIYVMLHKSLKKKTANGIICE